MDDGQCPLALLIAIRDGHRTERPEERISAPVFSAIFNHTSMGKSNGRRRRASAERIDWDCCRRQLLLGLIASARDAEGSHR